MNGNGKRPAALVTGGAKRIGARLALRLAMEGFDIALHYNSSEEKAIETRSMIRSAGTDCSIFKGDLKDLNFIRDMAGAAFDTFPGLSVLINCASVFRRAHIKDTAPAVFDEMISVNLRAPFFLIKEFAKYCGSGCVINILDTKISKAQSAYAAYIVSRTGLNAVTALAAAEYAPGLRVNAVCPGLVLPAETDGPEYVRRLEARNLLSRKGSPEDIADGMMWLINASFVTGQTVYIDGGENIK